ncbi:MAG: hypothetical protein DRI81_17480 [Chloroflexi bacterium]|nr:MAG: hypothetical protein DRI81_17480 [Chloroflexota bacterium]HEY73776.1 hypothetical protein [Thermoflexia bacterium]
MCSTALEVIGTAHRLPSVTHLLESDYLLDVARDLKRILSPDHYIVFGHTHRATLERLGKQM